MQNIGFNRPYLTGKELSYIYQAAQNGHISGNGEFTKKCHDFFSDKYHFKKCLLTTSCTDALEMAALLIDIKPGDEVIAPAFTFVSSALAFVRQGAVIRFVDSRPDHPGMNESLIRQLINDKTRAIVVMHYGGVACDMDFIMDLANEFNLFVIEDAAQAINSFYKDKPLGSIGHFGCFSFHETKNIQCGEGGMITINDELFFERAEIIWEKGTNRTKYFRGEIDKYTWVDLGSSFLPSDITAAFLLAQLEYIDIIQQKRKGLWQLYFQNLRPLESIDLIRLPFIPEYATNNAHIFYIICKTIEQRSLLISQLKSLNIISTFHYVSLHSSEFMKNKSPEQKLVNAEMYSDCLLRLPLFFELTDEEVVNISRHISDILNA